MRSSASSGVLRSSLGCEGRGSFLFYIRFKGPPADAAAPIKMDKNLSLLNRIFFIGSPISDPDSNSA